MYTRIILYLVLVLFSADLDSQVFRRFSADLDKYPEELDLYMGTSLNEQEILSLQEFILQWTGGEITDTNKSYIIAVSNFMLSKQARPKPHYMLFLQTFRSFETELTGQESLDNWKKALYDLVSYQNTRLSQIQNFIQFSNLLINDNIINKTTAATWKTQEPAYRILYADSLELLYEDVTLTCMVVRDSFNIYHTSGIYNPETKIWKGTGGVVTWERSEYEADVVNAELSSYTIDMTLSNYRADSVSFSNLNYLDYRLYGTLEDRGEQVSSADRMNYPRFESYLSNYRIDDLYTNINFNGGLSMYGSTLVGSGTKFNKARLTFFRNDSLKLIARSAYFAMEPGKITSSDVEVSIPIGFDSIVHPNIGMTYFVEKNQLSLNRNQRFQSEAPYYNNYHKVEMTFEQLQWNLDENRILFKMREASATGLANFQSENLYERQLYQRLQGIDRENPMVALRRYAERVMGITFLGKDYAADNRIQHNQLQQMLKRLAVEGFLIYDIEDDQITLRQKLFDWVYASVDAIDYDVINLISETEAPQENASLDLSTYDLTIKGIRNIRLSTAQNVMIFPENATIILKQNRSFQFNGVIVAGLFTFFGNNFFFDYDEFKLDLQDIDSVGLRIRTNQLDASGRARLQNIQSMIQDVTGELLIDDIENKSGRMNFPQYPVFTSGENSFVYYDDPGIQNGVYTRDKFFFEIYPFTFDSLDNFNPVGLQLDGKFVSAGIFPEMEQTLLIIQEDNSLGFDLTTDASGLPLYGGKGQYYDFLQMSHEGLRGNGSFEYLCSEGVSEDIFFHPDSMFGTAQRFEIGQQLAAVEYPAVSSTGNDFIWYPYQDQMDIAQGPEPFGILNDSTVLEGTLALGPGGLTGSGKMDLANSVLLSDHFTYTANAFAADTADLRLKSVNTRGYTLITDNVNAKVDFDDRSGLFKTNQDYSLVEFPENQYVSQLDLFQWNMDDNELVMGSASTADEGYREVAAAELEAGLVGPRYISTDPYQDSLDFVSTKAVYDYRRNIIRASNVKYIKSADAYIFPAGGEIFIEPDGTMGEMDSARILANQYSKLHSIYNATVRIEGRYKYHGGGKYDYIDETGQIQVIDFDLISVDDSIRTIASGKIPVEDEFTLSPYYGYTGEVYLVADKKFLTFNGGAMLVHDCEEIDMEYVKFEAEIDPENIYIPIAAQSFNYEMNPLYQGLFVTHDSSHIYPSFFSRRKLASDTYIVTADGYLYFDRQSDQYRVGSMDKLADFSQPGNYLSLPRTACEEYGEGRMRLGISLGQIRTSTIGDVTHNMATDETVLNLMYGMNFFMSEEALAIMASDLDSLQELEAVDLSDEFYNKGMAQILGTEKANQLQAELGLYGEYQALPSELLFSLFFSRLKLNWDQTTRSYLSEGKIGIGSINGNQIHKQVNGHMALAKRRSGDLFDVYLELDSRTWYYFGYTRGVLHVLSSNRDFNMTINNLKTNQRKLKTAKNEIPYIFIVTTAQKKDLFLRSVRQAAEEDAQGEEGQ